MLEAAPLLLEELEVSHEVLELTLETRSFLLGDLENKPMDRGGQGVEVLCLHYLLDHGEVRLHLVFVLDVYGLMDPLQKLLHFEAQIILPKLIRDGVNLLHNS